MSDFLVRIDDEVRRVNNFSAIFPIGADFVGVFGNFQAVTDRKCRAGALDHFFGFFQGIDRERYDFCGFLLELFDMRLKVGYLPNAVGSPDAAIEYDDGVLAFEIGGNI